MKVFLKRSVRYTLGSGFATLLDLGTLYFLTDDLGLPYFRSTLWGFCLASIFSFFFHTYVTFYRTKKNHAVQLTKFFVFQLIGQGIYVALLRIGVERLGVYYMYAAVGAKFLVFLRQFFVSRYIVFNDKSFAESIEEVFEG